MMLRISHPPIMEAPHGTTVAQGPAMTSAAKRILTFLLLAAAVYIAAVAALANIKPNGSPLIYRTASYYIWPGGTTWMQFHEFAPHRRYDAVIVGSSHAYRGYDPAVFAQRGFRVFNLGSSSQTPLNSYWLIRAFLDSTNAPLVIFDAYDTAAAISGFESTMDLGQNQPSNEAAIGMAWSQRDLRMVNMLAVRFLADRSTPFSTNPEYMGSGFTPHLDSMKTDAPPDGGVPAHLLARQKYFIGQCIDLCEERGIALVFTSHFARANLRGRFHDPMVHFMDSLHTARGIRFLDFTRLPGIDDRNWFADANHLNLAGARIFTGQLVDSLVSLGYLHPGTSAEPFK